MSNEFRFCVYIQILQEKAFERKQGEEDDVMIDYETMRFVYSD